MKFELKRMNETWAVLGDGQVLAAFGSEKAAEKWMIIEQKKERLKAASNQFRDALDDLGAEGIEVDAFVTTVSAESISGDRTFHYHINLSRLEVIE